MNYPIPPLRPAPPPTSVFGVKQPSSSRRPSTASSVLGISKDTATVPLASSLQGQASSNEDEERRIEARIAGNIKVCEERGDFHTALQLRHELLMSLADKARVAKQRFATFGGVRERVVANQLEVLLFDAGDEYLRRLNFYSLVLVEKGDFKEASKVLLSASKYVSTNPQERPINFFQDSEAFECSYSPASVSSTAVGGETSIPPSSIHLAHRRALHRAAATIENNCGLCAFKAGRLNDAEIHFFAAASTETQLGADADNPAATLFNLAQVEAQLGKAQSCVDCCSAAAEHLRAKLNGERGKLLLAQLDESRQLLLRVLFLKAATEKDQRRFSAAIRTLFEAIRVAEEDGGLYDEGATVAHAKTLIAQCKSCAKVSMPVGRVGSQRPSSARPVRSTSRQSENGRASSKPRIHGVGLLQPGDPLLPRSSRPRSASLTASRQRSPSISPPFDSASAKNVNREVPSRKTHKRAHAEDERTQTRTAMGSSMKADEHVEWGAADTGVSDPRDGNSNSNPASRLGTGATNSRPSSITFLGEENDHEAVFSGFSQRMVDAPSPSLLVSSSSSGGIKIPSRPTTAPRDRTRPWKEGDKSSQVTSQIAVTAPSSDLVEMVNTTTRNETQVGTNHLAALCFDEIRIPSKEADDHSQKNVVGRVEVEEDGGVKQPPSSLNARNFGQHTETPREANNTPAVTEKLLLAAAHRLTSSHSSERTQQQQTSTSPTRLYHPLYIHTTGKRLATLPASESSTERLLNGYRKRSPSNRESAKAKDSNADGKNNLTKSPTGSPMTSTTSRRKSSAVLLDEERQRASSLVSRKSSVFSATSEVPLQGSVHRNSSASSSPKDQHALFAFALNATAKEIAAEVLQPVGRGFLVRNVLGENWHFIQDMRAQLQIEIRAEERRAAESKAAEIIHEHDRRLEAQRQRMGTEVAGLASPRSLTSGVDRSDPPMLPSSRPRGGAPLVASVQQSASSLLVQDEILSLFKASVVNIPLKMGGDEADTRSEGEGHLVGQRETDAASHSHYAALDAHSVVTSEAVSDMIQRQRQHALKLRAFQDQQRQAIEAAKERRAELLRTLLTIQACLRIKISHGLAQRKHDVIRTALLEAYAEEKQREHAIRTLARHEPLITQRRHERLARIKAEAGAERRRCEATTVLVSFAKSIVAAREFETRRSPAFFYQQLVLIQSVAKGTVAQMLTRAYTTEDIELAFRKQSAAAVVIQTGFRGYAARKLRAEMMEKLIADVYSNKAYYAAAKIQATYKMHTYGKPMRPLIVEHSRKMYALAELEARRLRIRAVAPIIQRAYRCHLARRAAGFLRNSLLERRREYLSHAMRDHAARVLQHFAKLVAAKAVLVRQRAVMADILKFREQQRNRMISDHMHAAVVRLAAVTIQRVGRAYVRGRRPCREVRVRKVAEWDALVASGAVPGVL